jgi:hypothetical protein
MTDYYTLKGNIDHNKAVSDYRSDATDTVTMSFDLFKVTRGQGQISDLG